MIGQRGLNCVRSPPSVRHNPRLEHAKKRTHPTDSQQSIGNIMVDRLKNKTALITGGSRGIGRAVAEAYAAEGANLVLNARDPERLENTAEEIRAAFGVDVSTCACDVADRDAVQAMVDESDARAAIDILVNNAGIYKPLPFVEYEFEDFRNIIEVNLYGVIHATQFTLRKMIPRKSGVIVNMASTAGKWGSRNQSAYNMSKHAVVGMTRCLGLEMGPHNIRANAICPFVVETDLSNTFLGGRRLARNRRRSL